MRACNLCIRRMLKQAQQNLFLLTNLVALEMATSMLKRPAAVHGEANTQAGSCSRASQTSSSDRSHKQAIDMNNHERMC